MVQDLVPAVELGGVVVRLHKGFGFIRCASNDRSLDIFFHSSGERMAFEDNTLCQFPPCADSNRNSTCRRGSRTTG